MAIDLFSANTHSQVQQTPFSSWRAPDLILRKYAKEKIDQQSHFQKAVKILLYL